MQTLDPHVRITLKSFAKLLNEYRNARGLSYKELAHRIGSRTYQVPQAWCSGRQLPPTKWWDTLAGELGIPDQEAHRLKLQLHVLHAKDDGWEIVRLLTSQLRRPTPPPITTGTPSQVAEDLYKRLVPLVGSWSQEAGLLPSSDYFEGGEADYVEYGPVPKESICITLDAAYRWFGIGATLVFGKTLPSIPRCGFGWFVLQQTYDHSPRECIESFEYRGKNVIFLRTDGDTSKHLKKEIVEYRPFLAAV